VNLLPTASASAGRLRSPPAALVIADGTLEALKWLALALMLLDHGNRFLWAGRLELGPDLTRMAAPLFAFVLAYNLARPGALAGGAYGRTLRRLLVIGLLSVPAATALNGAMPLNIMFSLAGGTLVLMALQLGPAWQLAVAGPVFLVAGIGTEYGFAGQITMIAAFAWCQQPSRLRFAVWVASLIGLWAYNGDGWSLLTAPVVLAAAQVRLTLPRSRWFFYAAYPAHLTLLWAWVALFGPVA
jgi:TraX protein